MALAFLNLGSSEVFLILVLFLFLFGAQKVPELARSLGRAKAELAKAQREVREVLVSEEERALQEQLAFERLREQQVVAQVADPEHAALARAAAELGIATAGKDKATLKADIAAKLAPDAGASAEGQKNPENAAGAQQ